MNDGPFPDRLSQLRARWEADPSSRIFLQLAEEYRHIGRVQDALAVLDKGLKEHPGYLSALVAKGRCLLELGEATDARAVLERVVQQDATQMVANKLLVRAYLETGEPERARERLDLYSLLNDSDPETEELRRKVKALERANQPVEKPAAAPEPPPLRLLDPLGTPEPRRPVTPAAPAPAVSNDDPFADLIAAPPRRPEPPSDIFDLGLEPAAPPAPAVPSAGPDVFDFGSPAPAPAPAPAPVQTSAEESLFVLEDAAPAPTVEPRVEATAETAAQPEDETLELAPEDDLFGLGTQATRRRYLESLSSEGIFDFGDTPAAPSRLEPAVQATPAASELPVFEPPFPEPGPAAYEVEEEEPFALAAPPVFEPLEADVEAPSGFDEVPPLVPGESAFPQAVEPAIFSEPLPVAPEPIGPPSADDVYEVYEEETEELAEPAATVTLGGLYLEQGHPREAERIFRDVLEREPDNTVAREGLERALVTPPVHRPLEAGELLEGFDPDAATGPNARKIHLLSSYLKRLRGGQRSRPHVS